MATDSHQVRRFASGPLHGAGLALYFILLPYVVVTRWNLSLHQTNVTLVRTLLVVLGAFWLAFIVQVAHNVVRLRRGHSLRRDGCAWLAGLVVVMLPFLVSSETSTSPTRVDATFSSPFVTPPVVSLWSLAPRSPAVAGTATRRRARGTPSRAVGALPLALMAKRRRDDLRQHQFSLSEEQIDETIALLRAADPALVDALRRSIGDRTDGVASVASDEGVTDAPFSAGVVVVCALESTDERALVSFAREGGRLRVPGHWKAEDVERGVVALHDGARLAFASDERSLLRALATRSLHGSLVVYLGDGRDLDEDLRACAVTIAAFDPDAPHALEPDAWAPEPATSVSSACAHDVRVELLRSDPRVAGLAEPFTTTLRRRCVEMATYLALHRHEPVTGDRLRTRVLAHDDVDASARTLANTASAVRRSLGGDGAGPRLHAVGPSGLYVTHALTSDVEIFHALVERARQLPTTDAAPLVREALALVHGEPLASALRGFEWFLAEGHAARLARDGEWAALVLCHDALARGDVELAYWALERGRLIDPYSDALLAALSKVPRLREFGGDGPGRAQHEPVGTGAGVVVGRPLDGLRHQIA